MATTKITLTIDEDFLKDIDIKAESENRSRSNFIENTLFRALNPPDHD